MSAPRAAPRRPRVLVAHARLPAAGGEAAVVAWMLQSLRERHDVTLLAAHRPDFAALNRRAGTSLSLTDLAVVVLPGWARAAGRLDPRPGSILESCLLLRHAKRLRRDYDLLISPSMEADLGAPGLQYVHVPWLAHVYPNVRKDCDLPTAAAKLRAVARGELRPWMLFADYSFERMRANVTLANSDWTARFFTRVYGVAARTLHPPAPGTFPHVPWDERANGFVAIGRLHPGKRFEWMIRTLARLRPALPDLRFYIVGTAEDSRAGRAYRRRLARLVREHRAWVELHEDVPRDDLPRLLAGQRYGLHAQINEHFGIAVAELARAGCIPFVHQSGGQVEIVGGDARLTFTTAESALGRIGRVVRDEALQRELRDRLAPARDRFTPERFAADFLGAVDECLAAGAARRAARRGAPG